MINWLMTFSAAALPLLLTPRLGGAAFAESSPAGVVFTPRLFFPDK